MFLGDNKGIEYLASMIKIPFSLFILFLLTTPKKTCFDSFMVHTAGVAILLG